MIWVLCFKLTIQWLNFFFDGDKYKYIISKLAYHLQWFGHVCNCVQENAFQNNFQDAISFIFLLCEILFLRFLLNKWVGGWYFSKYTFLLLISMKQSKQIKNTWEKKKNLCKNSQAGSIYLLVPSSLSTILIWSFGCYK